MTRLSMRKSGGYECPANQYLSAPVYGIVHSHECVDVLSAVAQVLVAVDKIILQPSGESPDAGWPARRVLRRVNYDEAEGKVSAPEISGCRTRWRRWRR